MAVEEKHTAKEWIKKLGTNPEFRYGDNRITKEQYEKMLKRQDTVKNLLNTGKNILQGIVQTVTPIGKELASRLQANYNTAVGKPQFGGAIRDALGYTNKLQPTYSGYPGYPYPPPQLFGPQYPREIYDIPPEVFTMGQLPPPPMVPPGITGPPGMPVPSEEQVVFLFDDKDDTISEIMGEFNTPMQAEGEVAKLRKQGLPAFYATKGAYINKARLKA